MKKKHKELIEVLRTTGMKIINTFRIFTYDFVIDENFYTAGALVLNPDNNSKQVVLNPKVIEGDNKFLLGVFIHEVIHDLLEHVPRMQNFLGKNLTPQDATLWNLAADHVDNKILLPLLKHHNMCSSKLEEGCVNLEREFPDKAEEINEMPVEILYRFLKENTELETSVMEIDLNQQSDQDGGKSGDGSDNQDNSDGSGQGNSDKQQEKEDSNGGNSENDNQQNSGKSGKGNQKIRIATSTIKTKDGKVIHKDYKIIMPPNQTKSGNDKDSKNKTNPISSSGMYELMESMKNAGLETNQVENELGIIKHPLDLKYELEKYFNIIKEGFDDVSWMKISKLNASDPNLDVLVPSPISRTVNVLVALDASGSISDDDYSTFIGILYNNAKYLNIRVVAFDTEIVLDRNLLDYEQEDLVNEIKKLSKRPAYGGTEYSPVFEIANSMSELDLVLFFTDLFPYEWPPRPKFKVLWIVRKDSDTMSVKVPYGKVVWF